jgi:nitrile hydratase
MEERMTVIHAASGVADLGGADGWGAAPVLDPNEPVFKEEWEGRAFAMSLLSMRLAGANLDAFRHAMNRLDSERYFDDGYYGRWLYGAENLLMDSDIIAPGTVEARATNMTGGHAEEPAAPEPHKPDYAPTAAGSIRVIDAPQRFRVGQRVRAKIMHAPGHTRLQKYTQGHIGTVAIVEPAQVLPDTHAHFIAENAQWVYTVRFDSRELFGPSAEQFTLNTDLYEDYMEDAS